MTKNPDLNYVLFAYVKSAIFSLTPFPKGGKDPCRCAPFRESDEPRALLGICSSLGWLLGEIILG